MDFERKLVRQIVLEWVNGQTPIEKVIQDCFQESKVGARDRRNIKSRVFNILRYRGDLIVQIHAETGFKASRILDEALHEFQEMSDWSLNHETCKPKFAKSPRDHLADVHGYCGSTDVSNKYSGYFDFVHFCLHAQMCQPVNSLRVRARTRDNLDFINERLSLAGFVQVPSLDRAWIKTEESNFENVLSEKLILENVVFQDLSSQIVSKVVGAKKPKMILDFCCGGGIKTRQLWEETDAQIVAYDVNPGRTKPLVDWVRRYGDSRIKIARSLEELKSYGRIFDAILLDVPCSGLGTLRRHPDLLFRQKTEHYRGYESTQRSILMTALPFLSVGGFLTYSTCTFRIEENHLQIKAFQTGSSAKWKNVNLPVEIPVEILSQIETLESQNYLNQMVLSEGILLTPTAGGTAKSSNKSQTSGTWLGDCFYIAQLQLEG